MIVYKMTDECYKEWLRVKTIGTSSYNEWYNKWQRMTLTDTTSYNK